VNRTNDRRKKIEDIIKKDQIFSWIKAVMETDKE
jgi:hypothetical protein